MKIGKTTTRRRDGETMNEALDRAEAEGLVLDVREDEEFWENVPTFTIEDVTKWSEKT